MSAHLPGLIWLVVLLIGNAFFVGAEFAVVSARRSQIEPRAASGSRSARTTLWAMEHATAMLATSQLGITVCSLLILTVSEPAIHHLLGYPLGALPLSVEVVGVVAFVVTLVLVSFLHVVFGEMVPKNMAFSVPDRAALLLAPPLVWVARAFRPVIHVLNALANLIVRATGVPPRDEATSVYTMDEVAGIVEQSDREGTLGDASVTLAGAFEFTDKPAREIEIPLTDIVLLPHSVTPGDIRRAVTDHGFSRYVVADESGEPTGYLHMKDVMELPEKDDDRPVPFRRLRRLVPVHRDSDLDDALARMRRHGAHIGVTIDDSGVAHGVIFLEDAIEVLVGEIHDAVTARDPARPDTADA